MINKIVSFGFKHGNAFGHASVIDVRYQFANPWSNRVLRDLSGTDEKVGYWIRRETLHFDYQYSVLLQHVKEAQGDIVYIGCTGGKHRSVYLAERLGKELGVEVEHRDLHR